MTRNYKKFVLLGILVFFLLLKGSPSQESSLSDHYPTGLIPLSAEQVNEIVNAWPRVTKVHVNRLGFERINRVRAGRGKPLLDPRVVKPVGRETESVIGATGTTDRSFVMNAESLGDLPAYVDNSTLPHFPPIRSQSPLGSCASFSVVYTQLSYMNAFQRNLDIQDNNDNTNKYSPKWAYNMVNDGSDSGSTLYDNYMLIERHGACTWAEFPYDSDYRAWCMDPNAWRNALSVRTNPTQYISSVSSDSGTGIVKELLTNGYILEFATYISSWQYKTIIDDPSTTDDDPEVGKNIAYWLNGTSGGHAMVVVGYNDAIWTDINGNGFVDPGEKGAFQIANSWGTGWQDDGLVWLAYDALRSVSAVSGGPSEGRVQAFHNDWVYAFTVRDDYSPLMIAEFTVNHAKRDQLGMTFGSSEVSDTTPSSIWTPSAIHYQGGAYAFDGTTTPTDGIFVYDFSDMLLSSGSMRRYYLGMRDNAEGDVATLGAFKIIDLTTDPATEVVSALVPQYADNGEQAYAYVDHTYQGPVHNTRPRLRGGQVNPTSGTTLDNYIFWVYYSDSDFDIPTVANVYINGTPHAMTAHSSYEPYDGWYYFQAALGVGTYDFRFHFEDGRGESAQDPIVGAYSGPVVTPSHFVTQPTAPSGEISPVLGSSHTYSTSGGSCNLEHDVQYRFDWGDGAVSDWLPAGQTSVEHSWHELGAFGIRAQARCALETAVLSSWSDPLTVNVRAAPKVDFNGDGQEDILWRYQGEGSYQGLVLVWLMDQTGSPTPVYLEADGIAFDETGALVGRRIGALDQEAEGSGVRQKTLAMRPSPSIVSGEMTPAMKLPRIPGGPIKTIMEGKDAPVAEPPLSMRDATDGGRTTVAKVLGRVEGTEFVDIPTRADAADMTSVGDGTTTIAAISRSSEVIIARVTDTGWEIAGTGDFNSDGKADILWRYYGPGTYQGLNVIWYMDGTTRLNEVIFSRVSDTNWRIAGTGDFNSDGKVDILWRYYGPGTYQGLNVIWHMDGTTRLSEVVFSRVSDTNWRMVGTGDFNSDGKTDILWRYHGTGTYQGLNLVWHMDGTTRLNEVIFSRVTDTAWEIGGTGDFDSDGKVDILWRYYGPGTYQGLNVIWYMDGTTRRTEEIFSRVSDTNWRIVNR